ncbi:MAG: class II glutamine amidotransferase [Alphaproteobacteria bacterium]|nr:class II glutamine amidotransferase [Alphaproteobacteria bacterium]
MCRWLAYSGRPILLSTMILDPEHSLIDQSLRAKRAQHTTNGDGFGVGWYDKEPEPGLFRDTLPAWNDENLKNLSQHIESRLFFAHVRASTGTAVMRPNCHPFRHGRWLFMHNGAIGGFEDVRRELDNLIAPAFYRHRLGTTDSETIFYLLLTNGLDAHPEAAIAKTVGQVLRVMRKARPESRFSLTAAAADGERVYAIRYSSDHASPTLFYSQTARIFADLGIDPGRRDPHPILIVSEPLDSSSGHWTEVAEAQLLVAHHGKVSAHAFAPE